jgi:hypothetical protein
VLLLPLLLLLLRLRLSFLQGEQLREFLLGQGAVVTCYQKSIPPPAPGQIDVMVVAQGHVMQQGLAGTQLLLPRYLVAGMHVLTDVFMKLYMEQPQEVRAGYIDSLCHRCDRDSCGIAAEI